MRSETALRVPRLIGAEGLGDLFQVLVTEGYRVIGPALQDGGRHRWHGSESNTAHARGS